jgi:hypothetical protein
MDDITFDKLKEQITETEQYLESRRYYAADRLILENQLIIMKVLDKLDDKITYVAQNH